jgi:hypothetical protein
MAKAKKLMTIGKEGSYNHILVERRWNYFDNDYDYFVVRIVVDEFGNVERYEEKIPREYGKELMGEKEVV